MIHIFMLIVNEMFEITAKSFSLQNKINKYSVMPAKKLQYMLRTLCSIFFLYLFCQFWAKLYWTGLSASLMRSCSEFNSHQCVNCILKN